MSEIELFQVPASDNEILLEGKIDHDTMVERDSVSEMQRKLAEKKDALENDLHNLSVQKAKLREGIETAKANMDWIVNGMSGGREILHEDDTSLAKLQKELTYLEEASNDVQAELFDTERNYNTVDLRMGALDDLGIDLLGTDILEGKSEDERSKIDLLQAKYLAYKDCEQRFGECLKLKSRDEEFGAEYMSKITLLLSITRLEEIARLYQELEEIFPGGVKQNFHLPNREKLEADIDMEKFQKQIDDERKKNREMEIEFRKANPGYMRFGGDKFLLFDFAKRGDFTIEHIGSWGVSKKRGEKVTSRTISTNMMHTFGMSEMDFYDDVVRRARIIQ